MAAGFEPAQQIRCSQFVRQRAVARIQFRSAPPNLNAECGRTARAFRQPVQPVVELFATVAFAQRFPRRAEFFLQPSQSVPLGQPFRGQRLRRDEQQIERAELQQSRLLQSRRRTIRRPPMRNL